MYIVNILRKFIWRGMHKLAAKQGINAHKKAPPIGAKFLTTLTLIL